MKPHFLAGATFALMTMTAIPAWAACHGTSSVDKPDDAVASESNADTEMSSDKSTADHLRAEEVAVEDLDEHNATEGNEDPAPEGYTTNVPADQIEDDADVGETTPETSVAESEDPNAGMPKSAEAETDGMKTDVNASGEYVEEAPEDEQIAMAQAEEATEKVEELTKEKTIGETGQVEAATGGAEPVENWFGCSDEDGSEGDTCEESQVEATPDEEQDPPKTLVTIETEKTEKVNLNDDCEDASES